MPVSNKRQIWDTWQNKTSTALQQRTSLTNVLIQRLKSVENTAVTNGRDNVINAEITSAYFQLLNFVEFGQCESLTMNKTKK